MAVETTASFIKVIQIPQDIPSGLYTVESNIIYQDQEVPASSSYQFTVERKIAGIFISQLIVYSIITLLVSLVFATAVYVFIKRGAYRAMPLHDYGDKPKQERIYYEMLSDILTQMRLRIGDDALELAQNIPDLKIDRDTGKILHIGDNPAKLIALLVQRYEKLSSQKINF